MSEALESMSELNKKMYDFVQRWAEGANLTMSLVSLPDCMAYDALSVIGRQLLGGPDQPEQKPEDPA